MVADSTVYENHGIRFAVPSGWDVSEQSGEEGDLTITVDDGAAFWMLTLMRDRPPVERVLDEAQAAFRDEYDDVDANTFPVKIAGRDAVAVDMHFVCLELINLVAMRCVRTGRFTAFVMSQVTDHERDYYLPIFSALTESLDLDRDGDVSIS